MSNRFEVDFSEAIRQLAEFQLRMSNMGHALDAMEKKSGKPSTAAKRLLKEVSDHFDSLEKQLKAAGAATKDLGESTQFARNSVAGMLSQIAAQNLKLTVQTRAYSGSLQEVERLLSDSAAKASFVKWAEKTRNLSADLSNQNKYLEATLRSLDTAEGRHNEVLKSAVALKRQMATLDARRHAENSRLAVSEAELASAAGRALEIRRAKLDADRKEATESTRLAAKLAEVNREYASLQGGIQAQIAVQQALNAVRRQGLTAGIAEQAALEKLSRAEQALATDIGKATATRKAKLAADQQAVTEATRLTAKLAEQRRAYEGLQGGIQAQIAAQAALNAGLSASVTHRQREQNQVDELRRRHESLTGGLAEQAAQLKVLNSAREREVTELTRERVKIEELTRALASLNGGEQEQIVRLQAKIAARRKAIQTDGEAVRGAEELTAAAARELVAEQRLKDALEARNRATLEEARALQQMTRVEAEAIAKAEALTAANKRQRDALLEEARAAHGLSQAQKELSDARDREIAKLDRLRAQKSLLSSSYGKELATLQRQIQEQQQYNRLLTMTTAELFGFTNAQKKANLALHMGSQSAAMMRAALSGLHTNIGMYTSATIVAASSTYALASAIRSTVSLGAEFTATMGRADAVMSTSGPQWLPSSMEAMEAQVRALGQSTIFTASEVAGGLVELGQAGLSASESIQALRPALDLAMIGNISMAESADISTNVMMTFGMQAKDLTEVVDIMAQAVSNSNTNIEQLANALTYAGPAAHTAGISMKDTIAAIEALSNTGIKASKAGTGLRRLFVSLLNPTKKGAEMLDKYGISVTDVEGNTRSLIDILGQLNKALYAADVTEGERLGAIQNLVGVYATSPVAALVGQAGEGGNLEALRRQLDGAAGAADRMREKIENSLKYDWKQVVSAYEEAQLQLFDANEYRLREMAASLTTFLIELTQPFKELKNEDGTTTVISNLDMLIQKAMTAGEALAWALGGLALSKVTGGAGNVFGALAADAGKAAPRIQVLSTRLAAATQSQVSLSLAAAGTSSTLRVMHGSAAMAAGGLGMLSIGAGKAATALHWVGVAGNVAMRGLGWIGLILGVGAALSTAFGADHEERILSQKEEVDKLKQSYEELQKAIDNSTLARERAALNKQIASDQEKVDVLGSRNKDLQSAASQFSSSGVSVPVAITDEILINERLIANLRDAIEGTEKALAKLNTTQTDVADAASKALGDAKTLADLEKTLSDAKAAYLAKEGQMRLREADAWKAAQAAVDNFKASLSAASEYSSQAARNAATMLQIYQHALQAQQDVLQHDLFDRTATTGEKLLKVRQQIADAERDVVSARDSQDPQKMNRRMEELQELRLKEQELTLEVKKQGEELDKARRNLEDFHRTDAQNLEVLKKELQDVVARKAVTAHLGMGGDNTLANEHELKRVQEELRLRQEISRLESSIDKEQKASLKAGTKEKSKADREAEQALKAAASAYENLRKQFDPLGVALAETATLTEQLNRLVAAGKITEDERAKALAQNAKAYHALTLEQDKNYQSLKDLRESYSGHDSELSKHAKELAELDRLYKAGAVSMAEYTRLKQRMSEAHRESLLSGLPTAEIGGFNTLSTPFSDLMSAQLDRMQNLGTYDRAGEQLDMSWHSGHDAINQETKAKIAALEAQKLAEQAHQEELVKIQEEANSRRLKLNQQFREDSNALSDQRLRYEQESNKLVMASMLGTAENILGMFASVGEDATTAQKVAFAAQKALAVAQIIMYTEMAAMRAQAEGGTYFGVALSSWIRAQGYASAALVGALAVGQMSGSTTGSSSSSGGSSYAGMYDTGGTIPYNQYGIVGEYGPEIVHGPARVVGRGASASRLGGDSGGHQITLAPQTNVTVESTGGDPAQAEQQGRELASMVERVTTAVVKDMLRPGGMLDSYLRQRGRG